MADDATPVLSRRDGAVQTLTLNRPQARNAMSMAMVLALREALAADGPSLLHLKLDADVSTTRTTLTAIRDAALKRA